VAALFQSPQELLLSLLPLSLDDDQLSSERLQDHSGAAARQGGES